MEKITSVFLYVIAKVVVHGPGILAAAIFSAVYIFFTYEHISKLLMVTVCLVSSYYIYKIVTLNLCRKLRKML